MRIVLGRKTEELTAGGFRARAARYRLTLLDIGTGDGAFPYRVAGAYPEVLCVGLDPNREALATYASKAQRKPARGGRANVLYVAAAVEALPDALDASADLVTVNFPWAGLLARTLAGDSALIAALTKMAREPWALQILINAAAPPPSSDRELSILTSKAVCEHLDPALGSARVTELPETARVASRWGGRLIRGSGRPIIRVRADFGAVPPEYDALLNTVIGL